MIPTWASLALLSAFGQALSWALKKKTLENKGINNTLGFVSFLTASVILTMLYFAFERASPVVLTQRFIVAALSIIGTNVLAVWAAYRALDRAPLSLLMPYVATSALFIVPIEYVLRDVVPNVMQVIGIIVLIVGAVTFSPRKGADKNLLHASYYFAITVLCYAVASSFVGVAVDESHSPLFAAAVIHAGIALGFIPLVLMAREASRLRQIRKEGGLLLLLLLMMAAGAVTALLENGPSTIAVASAKASEVFALKRTMPFFALLLGAFMFGERVEKRHIYGTSLLVAGSLLVVWFR